MFTTIELSVSFNCKQYSENSIDAEDLILNHFSPFVKQSPKGRDPKRHETMMLEIVLVADVFIVVVLENDNMKNKSRRNKGYTFMLAHFNSRGRSSVLLEC